MTELKRRLSVLIPYTDSQSAKPQPTNATFTVLVLNANREMANEITKQMAQEVDECSIIYAPTIELAKLLLRKHRVDLVVSSPILPDGHITKLQPLLESLQPPPDLVVFADEDKRGLVFFEGPRYHFVSVRQVESTANHERLSGVSQEIRDSLNNPLQEIVALVFVAHTTQNSPSTNQALVAIEKAAQKMAGIVWGLEEQLYQNLIECTPTRALRR